MKNKDAWMQNPKMTVRKAQINKPWGYERIIEQSDVHVIKEIHVKKNSRLSLQYHENKIETMFVICGQGYLGTINGQGMEQVQSMQRMWPYFINKEKIHRLFTKDESCTVIEVSSPELNDVVRLKDDYGRC